MSRSYKKTAYSGQRKSKYYKRLSNKWVRRHDVQDGCAYKKNFYRYSIWDYGHMIHYSRDNLKVYVEKYNNSCNHHKLANHEWWSNHLYTIQEIMKWYFRK